MSQKYTQKKDFEPESKAKNCEFQSVHVEIREKLAKSVSI